MKATDLSFVLGMAFMTALTSASKGYLGKDFYINYLQNNWDTFPWQVIAVIVIGTIFSFISIRKS